MTRGALHWQSSTSRPEICWPRRGRSLRKAAKGQPESTPVEPLLSGSAGVSPASKKERARRPRSQKPALTRLRAWSPCAATGPGAPPVAQIIHGSVVLLGGGLVPQGEGAEPLLPHWHTADGADIAERLGTSSSQGLSPQEASRRLMRGGANAMPSLQQRSELSILLGQFSGLPVALLAGAALVSVAIGGFLEAGALIAVGPPYGGLRVPTPRPGGAPRTRPR